MTETEKDLWNALAGMIGFVQLISNRGDVSPALREALATNHRVVDAMEVLQKTKDL